MHDPQFSRYIFFHKRKKHPHTIYIITLLFIVCVITLLPFIKVNISVKAKGFIRPVSEKTEIRSLVPEVVEKVYVTEDQYVEKDQLLIRLSTRKTDEKLAFLKNKHDNYRIYLNDLNALTGTSASENAALSSELYKTEQINYQNHLNELEKKITKAVHEVNRFKGLYENEIIPPKDFEDLKYNLSLLQQEKEIFISSRRKRWNLEQNNYLLEIKEIESDMQQLSREKDLCRIRSPESGTIENFRGIYPGSPVQAGQSLAVISPDTGMISEVYVSTKNIGYIHNNLKVKIQVDAFDYNKWGMLEGRIFSISNDYTLLQNTPVFIVKCHMNKDHLQMRNGITGDLKKGMTVTARFVITRESLLNLLYKEFDDWLNPSQYDIPAK